MGRIENANVETVVTHIISILSRLMVNQFDLFNGSESNADRETAVTHVSLDKHTEQTIRPAQIQMQSHTGHLGEGLLR